MTITYTFSGAIDKSYEAWNSWTEDMMMLFEALGRKANHYYVDVEGKDERIRRIGNIKRKIANAQKCGRQIADVEILELPDDYEQAMTDYAVRCERGESFKKPGFGHVSFILNKEHGIDLNETLILETLQKHIQAESGEIFEMDEYELPATYAMGCHPAKYYKTLKVISKLL